MADLELTKYVECRHGCGYYYTTGPGWYEDCPRCTDQPEPEAERLADPKRWPGHRWIWSDSRGPRGRWVEVGDYAAVPIEDFRELAELLQNYPLGDTVIASATTEIKRLRALLEGMVD